MVIKCRRTAHTEEKNRLCKCVISCVLLALWLYLFLFLYIFLVKTATVVIIIKWNFGQYWWFYYLQYIKSTYMPNKYTLNFFMWSLKNINLWSQACIIFAGAWVRVDDDDWWRTYSLSVNNPNMRGCVCTYKKSTIVYLQPRGVIVLIRRYVTKTR